MHAFSVRVLIIDIVRIKGGPLAVFPSSLNLYGVPRRFLTCTAHGGGSARIEKRRVGLFVAGPQACPRSVTPAVADDSPSPHQHHDPVRTC